jgi:hypothetical protein
VEKRRSRGIWALLLILGSIWADVAFSTWIAIVGVAWAQLWISLTQLGVAAGIGSFDLLVLWLYIGIWEYKGRIRLYMRSAFGSDRTARFFSICPRCGYESEREHIESKAEEILRSRGA